MYQEFGLWIKQRLGCKCQKISINAGFTCPNRDGRLGTGGCTFCNNQTFNPEYCETGKSVTEQLEEGKDFFRHKYPDMRFLAYFQAYTSTYASVEHCISLYEEALKVEDVAGIVISTRPDCMPDELLDYLEELNQHTFVLVEYGVESANDQTLKAINRGHTFRTSADAIRRTAQRGIAVGAHVILGLPGEDKDELLRQADLIAGLPLTTLKLHQLQIIKGTRMEKQFREHPWHVFSVEEYVDLVSAYLARLPRTLVIDRFVSSSPKQLLVAPQWGLKNFEFANLIRNRLNTRI